MRLFYLAEVLRVEPGLDHLRQLFALRVAVLHVFARLSVQPLCEQQPGVKSVHFLFIQLIFTVFTWEVVDVVGKSDSQ